MPRRCKRNLFSGQAEQAQGIQETDLRKAFEDDDDMTVAFALKVKKLKDTHIANGAEEAGFIDTK